MGDWHTLKDPECRTFLVAPTGEMVWEQIGWEEASDGSWAKQTIRSLRTGEVRVATLRPEAEAAA